MVWKGIHEVRGNIAVNKHTWVVKVLDDLIDYAELNHMHEFAVDLRGMRAKHHATIVSSATAADHPGPLTVLGLVPNLK